MANWQGTFSTPSYSYDGSSLTVAANTSVINNVNRSTVSESTVKVETVSLKTRPTSGQLFPR
jgi:hypothetical protein